MRDNGRYNKRNGLSKTNESQMVSVHYLFGLITMAMVTMVLSSSLYSCYLTEVPFIVDINCNVLVPHPNVASASDGTSTHGGHCCSHSQLHMYKKD